LVNENSTYFYTKEKKKKKKKTTTTTRKGKARGSPSLGRLFPG
jgi:hypothetical protein